MVRAKYDFRNAVDIVKMKEKKSLVDLPRKEKVWTMFACVKIMSHQHQYCTR